MPRIWFITGCSSGFGRQLAIAAAQNKDTVVAASRDPTKLADLASQGVIAKKLDVRASDAEVKAVIDDVLSTVGPIDILVNNAGYILEGGVEECSHQEIVDQFDVNVFSQIRVLRAVLPSMRAPAIAIYTESLRNELAPFNIEVTCVEPGYFRTNFLTSGHKVTAQNHIPELDPGTQATRDALAAYSLHQPGDPVKGAQVLLEAFTKTGRCEGRRLPGRLALGRDALAAIGGSIAREQEMLDSWGEIVGSTNCDDVSN
ncbi:NAD(P)-binding protein [Aspergillus campestris IBT 28561]|uniref:NAD(P)-binding protein n=1 Tax=Aspergillus campestris (strain IBT 28561) TaxID=1392248 RepID=A0A2I1DGX0_ASPC2|nr:NAD(P)-binding protein [Aspergillus campestris IBT 28561]PKY09118.1 NAD(P)-binding protein [Aspergillus campestris IBT 28561]